MQKRLKNGAGSLFLTAIDTPLSISLAEHLTPEERAELLLTVETLKMFTEANPDNDQSLEILKDTYWKLGQQEDALATTRQLAEAYLRQGQYSAALLEYEGMLAHQPDSQEIQALIADLDAQLNPGKPAGGQAPIALDFGVAAELFEAPETATPNEGTPGAEPALIATAATRQPDNAPPNAEPGALVQDYNGPLARFLIQHRLASREVVETALERVKTLNADIQADPNTPSVAAGLLDELIKAGVEAETLLAAILDRTKFAYIPLESYDVDRQIVRMLPESLTLGRRVVPFDIVSRTMMVALDNPFDTAVKTLVQQTVDYHVQWHLAMPGMIHRILRESYRLPG
ncbi:MAG: tetratricopeptide repeat protein [Verrucomicrobiota bacterium]